jgi:hypothetical protein
MTAFLYTNWRGKTFVIDEVFARQFREYMLSEGCTDVEYITPEYLYETLPFYESLERKEQLEKMWEESNGESHSNKS